MADEDFWKCVTNLGIMYGKVHSPVEKLNVPATYFQLFQWNLWAPGSCPSDPPLIPAVLQSKYILMADIQFVPLATEPGIYLIFLPLIRILQRNFKRTTDTFLFISQTTNVLLFKFRCNIFIGVSIIKEMPCSVASGRHCIFLCVR